MAEEKLRFGLAEHSITLTGEEWTAILAKLIGRGLSLKGTKAYNRAAGKIQTQLTERSRQFVKEGRA